MIIAGKNFYFKNNTYIMGILNLTPDSFSDGSLYNNEYSSIKHAVKMVNDGASIIDIGCESTRPNCTKISEKNEIERFKKLAVPVIKEMKKLKIPISIDTYKPKVLKFALEFGIDILNDIWGFKYDETMAKLCYQYKIPCILMHNRTNENYENFEEDIINELNDSIKIAKKNCIKDNEIIIDPGIGFAKSHEQNLWIIKISINLKNSNYL